MSFLKRLFGGGGGRDAGEAPAEAATAKEAEHNGFLIRATPYNEGGQYQTCGVISKEVNGVMKEHRFIRADKFASLDDAVNVSLSKGRQIINEQGERMFE
ncbi:HlyU family transcriptional regulator [Phyllobacterium phragmitis]|uniref:HlyU family transcriptional regulator n=1 Tax=Phyllobacterium phragmitis TaxID=2670329 RepID=A0ABQ0H0U9_9HYPH